MESTNTQEVIFLGNLIRQAQANLEMALLHQSQDTLISHLHEHIRYLKTRRRELIDQVELQR